MSIKRRNCIRHDEDRTDMEEAGVKMEVFEDYSRPSCIIECRARHIFSLCKCLPYYYPSFAQVWKKNTSCDAEGLLCIAKEAGETVRLLQVSTLKTRFPPPPSPLFAGILRALDTGEKSEFFAKGADCYCPVDCEENLYVPEMSQADIRETAKALQVRLL